MKLQQFDEFLQGVDLAGYREKYRPIKIVEMDLQKEIKAIGMLYKIYWDNKKLLGKEIKNKIDGEFVDILYNVPGRDVFDNPKTLKGELRKPYREFIANKNLKRFDNGFIVFTPLIFEQKKKEIDSSSE